jgi:hypothetical protein
MQNVDDSRQRAIAEAVAEASGRRQRDNPVLPTTGGPAGNALLTAWTGLVLLVLSVAELLTLFNVRGLISWHVAIGALLVPPALMKTATTTWRMARYYLGNAPYQKAGPPPTLFRLLGPLVVLSTLGLLSSGIVLILVGQQSSEHILVSLLGYRISWVSLHQIAFAVWASATGVHLLGRIVPALRIVFRAGTPRQLPGGVPRVILNVLVITLAIGLAFVLLHADASWNVPDFVRGHGAGFVRTSR